LTFHGTALAIHGTIHTLLFLVQIAADEMVEVESISAGEIGAVMGLKHTQTGDTLLASNNKPTVLPSVEVLHLRLHLYKTNCFFFVHADPSPRIHVCC
jgi:predicted membrane GTPase involved in stress response